MCVQEQDPGILGRIPGVISFDSTTWETFKEVAEAGKVLFGYFSKLPTSNTV